ncbi:hypothetical protein HDU89_004047 [Geranomyces variabilis]|nr:hypothetical protein HDU89_004047 [Geranomyces variabilis]
MSVPHGHADNARAVAAAKASRMPLQRTFLRPSPGEEERLRVEERAKAKLLRLEQVRRQAREIAAERRSQYSSTVDKEWGTKIHELQSIWSADHEAKLLALRNMEKKQHRVIGDAQRRAGQVSRQQEAALVELRNRALKRVQREIERGQEALSEEKTQQHFRDEIELQRRRLLYTVRESEDQRAMEVARERRLRSLTEAETVEILSNPTQRVEFLRTRAHDGGQFQHTYAHRGQAATATKCDFDPDAAANGKADAWAEAQRAAAKKRQEDAVKARQAERLKEKTAQRSKKAEHDAAMNKQKDLLLRALASLHSRDRQNKVRSVATDACRPPRLKPEELESRFTKIFDIGARTVSANPR